MAPCEDQAAHFPGADLGDMDLAEFRAAAHRVADMVADYLEGRDNAEITPPVLDELMTVLHTELGHRTLASWSVPEPICHAALHHHDEDIDPEHPLAVRVQAADAIACKMGFHLKPEPELDLLSLPAIEYLNLSDIEIASMIVDLEDQVAEIRRLV